VPIPKGALLAMNGVGLSLLYPPSDLRIGRCVFRGGTTIELRAGMVVASGVLAEVVELGGLPCAAGAALIAGARPAIAALGPSKGLEGAAAIVESLKRPAA